MWLELPAVFIVWLSGFTESSGRMVRWNAKGFWSGPQLWKPGLKQIVCTSKTLRRLQPENDKYSKFMPKHIMYLNLASQTCGMPLCFDKIKLEGMQLTVGSITKTDQALIWKQIVNKRIRNGALMLSWVVFATATRLRKYKTAPRSGQSVRLTGSPMNLPADATGKSAIPLAWRWTPALELA